MSIVVAVRVRPFNQRELEMNSELCIQMDGNQTTIQCEKDDKDIVKSFSFDYSFWSHDGFTVDETGYSSKVNHNYIEQRDVFECMGKQVIDNAFLGYHTCLFAYGQTGSGKSYSMVGHGANKGVIPIACEEIFKRMSLNTNPNLTYQVHFSMLEIYNEKVQDLLIQVKDRLTSGLKVRQHPKFGVFVEGLSKHVVECYEAIQATMERGNHNRTIASTMMNSESSRAHTIMQIEFKQIELIGVKRTEKLSLVNLVDLAGSEKQSKTGNVGDRLKEGCSINKSLHVLGLVISDLADKAMGKNKTHVTPYRDSSLTRILQEALGGNSRTLMICALSPAMDNYEETLSTLRYADQAKKIKCHAVVNESEQDRMIRDLKTENEELKRLIQEQALTAQAWQMNQIETDRIKDQIREYQEKLAQNNELMRLNQDSYEQEIQQLKNQKNLTQSQQSQAQQIISKNIVKQDQFEEDDKVDETKPHLSNLNEDPQMSGSLKYSLDQKIIHIGKTNGDPKPDIIMGLLGMQKNHAIIENNNGKLYIQPYDQICAQYLFLNAENVESRVELHNNDRLKFGTKRVYWLVHIPGQANSESTNKLLEEQKRRSKSSFMHNSSLMMTSSMMMNGSQTQNPFDWDFAEREFSSKMEVEQKKNELSTIQEREAEREAQNKKQEQEIENEKQKFIKERMKILDELEQLKQKSDQSNKDKQNSEQKILMKDKLRQIETEFAQNQLHREQHKHQLQQQQSMKNFELKLRTYYEKQLKELIPKIIELNLMSKEMKRKVFFTVKLMFNYYDANTISSGFEQLKDQGKIFVQVNNQEEEQIYLWDIYKDKKFENRCDFITDIYSQMAQQKQDEDSPTLRFKSKEEDPLWDPPEHHLIGQCFISLQPLSFLMDNPCQDIPIVNETGEIGTISANVYPVDSDGNALVQSSVESICSQEELLGKRLDFVVNVDQILFSKQWFHDIYIEYDIFYENNQFKTFKTEQQKGDDLILMSFNYTRQHTYLTVSEDILNKLINRNIQLRIYGKEDNKYITKEIYDKSIQLQQIYGIDMGIYDEIAQNQRLSDQSDDNDDDDDDNDNNNNDVCENVASIENESVASNKNITDSKDQEALNKTEKPIAMNVQNEHSNKIEKNVPFQRLSNRQKANTVVEQDRTKFSYDQNTRKKSNSKQVSNSKHPDGKNCIIF